MLLGGDEFVAVLALDQTDNVSDLAQRLIETLSQPFLIGGHTIEIGASIGIALYPQDGVSHQILMHAADTALYQARSDRNTFCFFRTPFKTPCTTGRSDS